MKKYFSVQILIFLIISFFFVSNSMAIGLGFYVDKGSGSSEWEVDRVDSNFSTDFDADNDKTSFGFVLDTTVAKDKLFNYRLQIGINDWEEELDNGNKFKIDGFVVDQDFGFGIVRKKSFRLWLGPELRLTYGEGTFENNLDAYLFGVGVGPVIGANFNIGKVVTITLKSAYLFEGYAGYGDWKTIDAEDEYSISAKHFLINAGLLFRINDMFGN